MPERKYTTNPECPECNGLAGQLRLVMKAISWGADFSGDRPGRKQGYAYEPLHCRKCLIEDPMPEPEDEVVRDAREAVLTGRASRSDNSFKRILDAYEAAIRASERAKVEALVADVLFGWADSECDCDGSFGGAHYRACDHAADCPVYVRFDAWADTALATYGAVRAGRAS